MTNLELKVLVETILWNETYQPNPEEIDKATGMILDTFSQYESEKQQELVDALRKEKLTLPTQNKGVWEMMEIARFNEGIDKAIEKVRGK